MGRLVIPKERGATRVAPNMSDYARARRMFSWEAARSKMAFLPETRGLNMAYEAVTRHALGPRRDHEALRFLRRDGSTRKMTFGDLEKESNRFAHVLQGLGVAKGDAVFCLLGRVPEVYVACLGTLKMGGVFAPLFSSFGPDPILARLRLGQARVLVTSTRLFEKKIANILAEAPSLAHVLLVDTVDGAEIPRCISLPRRLAEAPEGFEIPATNPSDPALLHFTSGTTGLPKGAIHVHEAVVSHHVTAELALDFHDDDVFWCTADPGWVTGTSYGIVAPLSHGITSIVDEGEFDVERWYRILSQEQVSVWYTAPTAIRMMMRGGTELPQQYRLQALRFIASVGEPLNPEAVFWGEKAFGLPIHDNWWQTETGGILIANFAAMDIRPGSMGKALPGVEVAVVQREGSGGVTFCKAGEDGELAIRTGWPSMFRGYLHDEERYRQCFREGWYLTGDMVRMDADGYVWFVGRGDDVIKSAGHLIGPFEVESALLEHAAVAEAAVIGKVDPLGAQLVKAFVSLKPGRASNDELVQDILGFGRQRLGPVLAPKEVEIVAALPRTRSGKIMRRLLRAREAGLPEGDTSTLETLP